MYALIRYVVREKDHSLKTVMRIHDFTKPFYQDELDQPDQNVSNASNLSARISFKDKKKLDKQKSLRKSKSKEVNFEGDI